MAASTHGSPAVVLLVDDEVDQVEMYRLGLEGSGFAVLTAFTGADALARARDRGPNVVVLDIRLPDMTGWEVCSALRANARTAAIPVIVLTAAVTDSLPMQAAAAGCAAFLPKPCYPEELTAAVRHVLAPQSSQA